MHENATDMVSKLLKHSYKVPKKFREIKIVGAPYKRGFQHGIKVTRLIHNTINLYYDIIQHDNIDVDLIQQYGPALLEDIQKYTPNVYLEMKGIADGAKVDIYDILLINCKNELLYPAMMPEHVSLLEGCTLCVALGNITQSGHTLIGQNWDWREAFLENFIIIRASDPETGIETLSLGHAGGLMRFGMNNRGIILGAATTQCNEDHFPNERILYNDYESPKGLPSAAIRHNILQQPTIYHATLAGYQNAKHSGTSVIAANNDAICLEVTPGEVFPLYPENYKIIHTNHFISIPALSKIIDTGIRRDASTLFRYQRAKFLLEQAQLTNNITKESIKDILFDKDNYPYSILRGRVKADPFDSDPGPEGWKITMASVIFDAVEKTMSVCMTPDFVEEKNFITYNFD